MTLIVFQVTILCIKALLASVLVAAGAAKLADVDSFTATLIGLGVSANSNQLLRGIAVIIPIVEVGLGMMLIGGVWPKEVNIATLALMAFFTIVTIIALIRHPQVTCRCFGVLSDSHFNRRGLIRSVALTLLALVVVATTPQQPLPDSPGSTALLCLAYAIFAIAVMQAAKAIAMFKERYQP